MGNGAASQGLARRYIVNEPCPALAEALAKALVEVDKGEHFEVLTSWESAIEDVNHWARLFGASVVDIRRSGQWVSIVIRR